MPTLRFNQVGHVALVTGANHGIGTMTAQALAAAGAAVIVSYLRVPDPGDATVPAVYRQNRAADATNVVKAIETAGGRALAIEADLATAGVAERLFDATQVAFGPADILINNATGWGSPIRFAPRRFLLTCEAWTTTQERDALLAFERVVTVEDNWWASRARGKAERRRRRGQGPMTGCPSPEHR